MIYEIFTELLASLRTRGTHKNLPFVERLFTQAEPGNAARWNALVSRISCPRIKWDFISMCPYATWLWDLLHNNPSNNGEISFCDAFLSRPTLSCSAEWRDFAMQTICMCKSSQRLLGIGNCLRLLKASAIFLFRPVDRWIRNHKTHCNHFSSLFTASHFVRL